MDVLSPSSPVLKESKKKKLSVERIYQKKTQLEHVLLRPDTYIGSVEPVTEVRSCSVDVHSNCSIPAHVGV